VWLGGFLLPSPSPLHRSTLVQCCGQSTDNHQWPGVSAEVCRVDSADAVVDRCADDAGHQGAMPVLVLHVAAALAVQEAGAVDVVTGGGHIGKLKPKC
jgi:hypothetical protein